MRIYITEMACETMQFGECIFIVTLFKLNFRLFLHKISRNENDAITYPGIVQSI